jgi:hypothetical protein
MSDVARADLALADERHPQGHEQDPEEQGDRLVQELTHLSPGDRLSDARLDATGPDSEVSGPEAKPPPFKRRFDASNAPSAGRLEG